MPTSYFQTTQEITNPSPFILKHYKKITSALADNLFRKKLYETPKKDIPNLLRYHYRRCDEPTEFADHVIELLEVALDENQDVKFLKSLSFWGDPEKAKRYKRRTAYALDYLQRINDSEPNEANIIRFPFNGEKVVLADASETAEALIEALRKTDRTTGADQFFSQSAINFLASVIYFFTRYEHGKYSTLAHVLSFLNHNYEKIFNTDFRGTLKSHSFYLIY